MLARKPANMQLNQNVQAKEHISVTNRDSSVDILSVYTSSSSAGKAFIRLVMFFAAMATISCMYHGVYDKQASICAKTENRVILLQQEKSMLELEVTELKSPNRIQTIAIQELGMVSPNEYIYSSSKANKVEKKVVQSDSIIRD